MIAARPTSSAERFDQQRRLPQEITTLISVVMVAAMIGTSALYLLDGERWGYAALGALGTAILWIPLGARLVSPFSTWGAGFLSVLIGFGMRGIFMSIQSDPDVTYFFLTDRSFSDFGSVHLLVITLLTCVTFGYTVSISGSRSERPPVWLRSRDLHTQTMNILIWVLASLGLIGSLLYIRAVGGFGELRVSDRRTTISQVDLSQQATFQSFGHWEYLASLSLVAFSIALARSAFSDERALPNRIQLVVLGSNALLLPWFTTTRADLIKMALVGLATLWHAGRPLHLKQLVLALLFTLTLGTVFTNARSGESIFDNSPVEVAADTLDTVILNRNMFDIGKTLLISDAVGDRLEVSYGSTIFGYVVAPVPRQLWPSKPLISPGPIVGSKIYGNRVSGVPPGFAGELVWSFGFWVSPIVALGLGALLGRLERFCIQAATVPLGAVFLSTVGMEVGHDFFGVSIGSAVFSLILGTAIVWSVSFAARSLGGSSRRSAGQ